MTPDEIRAEMRRFHMRCGHCHAVVVPQLMPFDPVELVRAFLREHAGCREVKP